MLQHEGEQLLKAKDLARLLGGELPLEYDLRLRTVEVGIRSAYRLQRVDGLVDHAVDREIKLIYNAELAMSCHSETDRYRRALIDLEAVVARAERSGEDVPSVVNEWFCNWRKNNNGWI